MQRPSFDRAAIQHLATLASLSLSEQEADSMARELGAIVAYVEELGAVDTSEVAAPAPTLASSGESVWRDDVVIPGLSHEDALGGAARTSEGGFAVPSFVSSTTGSDRGSGR